MVTNQKLTIEPAEPGDVETLADLWVQLAREQREHGSYVLPDANRETILETLEAHRVGDGLLVARLEGELAGFASFSVERGTFSLSATRGLLSNLYVRPAYRNRGVGSALLEAVERSLAEQGADVLVLEAMADNEAARRFYRRNGYEEYRVALERSLEERSESDTHSKE